MVRDYVSEAHELVDDLRSDTGSLMTWAEKIDDAISHSFGSLEIFMALRFHISEMLVDPETVLGDDRRVIATELADAIDEALRL